jgi:hypothetical protein
MNSLSCEDPSRFPLIDIGKRGGTLAKQIGGHVLQYLWWCSTVDKARIGFHRRGLLTAVRRHSHKRLRRKIHIGVLSGGLSLPNVIDFQIFWLNERCRQCHFSRDPDPHEVDILWVHSQDPLDDARRRLIEDAIAAARPGTPVINSPIRHDFYHSMEAFAQLENAGVSVPRSKFSEADIGKTRVIRKPIGKQSTLTGPLPYSGPVAGFRQFELVDCQEADGLFGRCRAFYIFGSVFPGLQFFCNTPIVRWADAVAMDLLSSVALREQEQIARIAQTSGLDFFAVDFLRPRDPLAGPIFVDINVFPAVRYFPVAPDYFGGWHDLDIFDVEAPGTRSGPSAWEMIDAGIVALLEGRRSDPGNGQEDSNSDSACVSDTMLT